MDFSTMTNEQLSDHLNSVLAEQERRQALDTIPAQTEELTKKFVEGGGNVDDLEFPWPNEIPGNPV